MISGSIARRYARALLAIGIDRDNLETLGAQVGLLAMAMRESAELSGVMTNPVFPRSDRRKVLVAVSERLGVNEIVKNFVMLLLDRERVGALPDIARELTAMIDARMGRVSAEVVSAHELTEAQVAQLKIALESLSGMQVQIERRKDPKLLGGVVAKVGDIVYDGSLRTQLDQMRNSLVE